MTSTRCERQGQVEIGILEHEGREFVALGASVIGRHITAYSKLSQAGVKLTSWCGGIMLDCRSEIVDRYWSGALALVFRLTAGRFIVGYSLGDGMLFRGELIDDCDDDEARDRAVLLSDIYAELDSEDDDVLDADARGA